MNLYKNFFDQLTSKDLELVQSSNRSALLIIELEQLNGEKLVAKTGTETL